MKKVLTVLTAMLVITSAFAQLNTSRQMTKKEIIKNHMSATKGTKVAGNPVWNQTMDYCGNSAYYSSVGNSQAMEIYWGIKIESAALVGRNTIEEIQFFVPEEDNGVGTFTITIREDSASATPRVTETVTTTSADTMAWKTVTLATPMTITQGHDLFICIHNSGLAYPAAFVQPNNYDNGKWASIDGITWDLVSNLGVDATWMIRAISDTYIELPPTVSIEGPATVRMNDTVVFTAVSPNADSYSWTVNADYYDTVGNTITVVWETAGTMTVEVDATNGVGTSNATMTVNVIDCSETIDEIPYLEDFEAPIPCWIMISNDAANDDNFGITSEMAYSGTSSFGFSSYASASDYNQYLITPEIDLPGGSDYMLSFWYNAYNASDAFRVLVSSTNTNLSSFDTVLDMPSMVITDQWAEARVLLPEGTKYVCINYYGDYAYYLWIDSLMITTLSAPDLALTGDTSIGTGQEGTYTALSTLASTFDWSVDNTPVSETGSVLTYTFTTPGTHTVEVSATNNIGTTTRSMTVDVFSCDGTTLPYTPDFSEGLHCWVSRSDDGDVNGWEPCNEVGIEGQIYSMSAESIFGMFMVDLNPDNWAISPVIAMPAEGSYDLTWKVMTYAEDYPLDHYAAYVITEDGTETMLYEETLAGHNTTFAQRVATIPSSVTGNFKVAFRHYDTEGGYVVILDDIKIVASGTVTGIDNPELANIAIYPNPVSNMLNVTGKDVTKVEIMDMTGRTVMTSTANHINISGIASGMYLVRVTTAAGSRVEKIVKK